MKGIDLKVYGTAPNGALLVSADEVNTGVQSLIDENNQLKQRNAELELNCIVSPALHYR